MPSTDTTIPKTQRQMTLNKHLASLVANMGKGFEIGLGFTRVCVRVTRLLHARVDAGRRAGERDGVPARAESAHGHQPRPRHHLDRSLHGHRGESPDPAPSYKPRAAGRRSSRLRLRPLHLHRDTVFFFHLHPHRLRSLHLTVDGPAVSFPIPTR